MRFFYRIFTPSKIPPIRIIQNQTPNGKQLKIAQVAPTESKEMSPAKLVIKNDVDTTTYKSAPNSSTKCSSASTSSSRKSSSVAAASPEYKKSNLKKLSLRKTVVEEDDDEEEETLESNCIYDYQEPDKEEIKKFAEKRDREWAMQKRLDAESHVSRKRKKSKKEKNEMHKKRKLHAEIAATEVISKSEDSLKLKVKIMPHNGHKHKHHRSSPPESPKVLELSPKERLLQMRQVRHKNIPNDEKPVGKAEKSSSESVKHKAESSTQRVAPPKVPENSIISGKTLRSDFTIKTTMSKELCSKYAVVNLERNLEQSEKTQKLTFLKKSPANAEQKSSEKAQEKSELDKEKMLQSKTLENAKQNNNQTVNNLKNNQTVNTLKNNQSLNTVKNNQTMIKNNSVKSLERKIANLHQQCNVVEASKNSLPNNVHNKNDAKMLQDKKVSFAPDKPQILNNQIITKSFTVSKVESGVKRKTEEDNQVSDKRPSLEITLINPPVPPKASSPNVPTLKPTSSTTVTTPAMSPKRPLPSTIPLVRIKKSVTLKSGISIIPKNPEKCDKIGALDLSKPGKSNEVNEYKVHHPSPKLQERLQQPPKIDQMRPGTPALRPNDKPPNSIYSSEKNSLSNLQMLSKVATEHPDLLLNKNLQQNFAKKPVMPSLQTLKIPVVTQNQQNLLAKMPKLSDISKGQMPRLSNLQVRNMRPTQNQSIRNIPNPSLLVRQQNQNRINAMKNDKDNSLAKVVNSLQQAKNNNSNGNVLVKGVDSFTKDGIKDDCKDLLEKKNSFEYKTVETVAN